MSNTFVTPTMVARDASIVLNNLLVVGNLVGRDKEAQFTGSKIGDSMKVTVPPVLGDADEFDGSTSATGITESEVDLTLDKHFYKRVDLTTKQKSLELHDFTRLITIPVMRAISQSVDKYMLAQLQVFRALLAGAAASRPALIDHLAGAHKVLTDALITRSGRVMLVDTTVEESLIKLAQFTTQDYGQDGPAGLRAATLGTRYGFRYVTDPLAGAHDRGDIAGTVLVNATTAAGSTTLALKDLTEATGTIKAGTVFTIAGDSTRYVIRKDATIASNAATVTIYPALQAQAAGDAGITFEAAGFQNIAFHPNAVTAAVVAPAPLAGGNSVTQSINGIGVRVSMDSSLVTLADSIVYDVYAGMRVIQPNGGCLVGGA